jgi:MFS family permease
MNYPNTNTFTMIASVFLLASWLGCMVITSFGMTLGRRTWIIIGCFVQVVGTIICATSFSAGQLIAGRVFIVCHSSIVWIKENLIYYSRELEMDS